MKRTFLIIFLSSFFLTSFSNSEFDTLISVFSKCSTVKDLESKLNTRFKDFTISKITEIFKRKIDFDYHQSVYGITVRYDTGTAKIDRINFITNSDGVIVFGAISLYNERNTTNANYYLKDSASIKSYLSKHNEFYSIELGFNDLIKQLSTSEIFGFGCGYGGGSFSEHSKKTLVLIEKENYDSLSLMLRQVSPEIQAYGVYGLIRLHMDKGIHINAFDENIIHYLNKRKSKIYCCSGCVYGLMKSINEIKKLPLYILPE